MDIQLQQTEDGSSTIYVPQLDEHYHSVHGAIQESMFVFIGNGLSNFVENQHVRVFEIGFGTGLNALLTLDYAMRNGLTVDYYAIEKYPLTETVYSRLNYTDVIGRLSGEFFRLHSAAWSKTVRITDNFLFTKINGDLVAADIGDGYDVVYQDAFAPDKQPELWSPDIFIKLYDSLKPGGMLVTYSAKGQVRRNMQMAGFTVERLPGPPGKREMLRGRK